MSDGRVALAATTAAVVLSFVLVQELDDVVDALVVGLSAGAALGRREAPAEASEAAAPEPTTDVPVITSSAPTRSQEVALQAAWISGCARLQVDGVFIEFEGEALAIPSFDVDAGSKVSLQVPDE